MKFIRNLLIIFVCFSCISLSLRAFYSYHQSKLFYASIKNEKGGKFLVGASLGALALNDSILKDWQNHCFSGTNFVHTFALLNTSLPYISQIDTIVITLGTHQIEYFNYEDCFKKELNEFSENDFFMSFQSDIWLKFLITNKHIIQLLCYNSIYNILHYETLRTGGHYLRHDDSNLKKGMSFFASLNTIPEKYSYNYTDSAFTTQLYFIRKTIDLCLKNNKVCVLMNFPIYQCDRWFNKMTYLDFLGTIEGKEKILIADYEDYDLSDSCYRDVVHLNKYGSDILCNDIKENGLRLERLPDFVASRRVAWRKNE